MNGKVALLIIDVQVGLIDGLPAFRGREVVERIAGLREKAWSRKIPVVYVQHSGPVGHPLEPNKEGWPICPEIIPQAGEAVIHKRACDSFFESELKNELERRDINHLIVAGCMTEYCVDTTCRRAVSLGYDVTLVKDAHSTGNSESLQASQIIEHHNRVLDGFKAGKHEIRVLAAEEIEFAVV